MDSVYGEEDTKQSKHPDRQSKQPLECVEIQTVV